MKFCLLACLTAVAPLVGRNPFCFARDCDDSVVARAFFVDEANLPMLETKQRNGILQFQKVQKKALQLRTS